MYRRRREKRRHIIQNIIWWHPIVLLLLMFILGSCTKSTASGYTIASVTGSESGITTGAVNSVETVSSGTSAEAYSRAESTTAVKTTAQPASESARTQTEIKENGNYTSKKEVALYLHKFGKLPSNYITKQQAEKAGWDSKKGNLSDILPGVSIGGSFFGNYDGKLPSKSGRKYYECDIDYSGGYRNSKRIIYSNDGLIYYTEDHYGTFEKLY